MKICPNCGKNYADTVQFCGQCGAPLPSLPVCPHCGQTHKAGAAFCPHCGKPLNQATPAQPETFQPETSQPETSQPETSQPETSQPETPQPETPQPEMPQLETPQPETFQLETPQPETFQLETPQPETFQLEMPQPETFQLETPRPVVLQPTVQELPPIAHPIPQPVKASMFCPHCGEKIPADSNFCPNCSAPIRPQLSPAKAAAPSKRGSSKIPLFILGSAVAVVVLAAAVFVLSRLFISPVDTFISAQEDVFIKPLLSALEKQLDVYNNGEFSSDITCSASVDSADVNKYLSDSSIVLKLDTNQNSLLANGDLILMGSPVLSGTLTYDKGKLGFYLPEIDDEYYVLELSEMLDSLGIADVDLSDVKMPELSGKEWRALAEAYLDITHTVITKENLEVERREDFYLDELGGSYTGTVYTFTPAAEDVEAMIEAVADHLEKDKDLRNAIMNLVNTDAFLELFGVYGYDDMESALDEGLQDLAEELRYRAEDIGESIEESDIRWKLYMEGKELRMVSIKSRKSDEMFVFEREGTESKGCSIAFYEASDDYNTVYLQAEYTKKGDACDGDLKISDGYRNTLRIDFTMDGSKRSVLGIPYGSYSFAVPDEDIRCSLEVSEGKSGSTDHVFSLRGDDYTFGGLFTKLDVTVNTTSKSSAKKPSVKATDISDYTEQELSKLLYNLGNRVMDNLNEAAYNLR